MRKVPVAVLSLLTFATILTVLPAKAASSALPAAAQTECAALNPSKGEEKFTGQISGGPTGSLIEVTYGDQTALVRYGNSVLVCEGGQPASVNALALGANVVVYGPMKHKGKTLEMTAVKIFVAGRPPGSMRSSEPVSMSNAGMTQGMDPVPSNPRTGSSQGSGTVTGADNWQTDSAGNTKGRSNSQNPGAISCSALAFTVNAHDEHTGLGIGRSSVSGITCKRSVDQQALQMAQDALTGRRLSSVTLNLQNQLEVSLNNAEITSVQFTSDNGAQVVEVAFAYQRAEIVHLPSGTRVTF